jgi:photosystem II stability/assembly factor-like uncharacterized protein
MIPRVWLLLALSVFTPFVAAQELEREEEPPVGEEGCLTERTADYLRRVGDVDAQTKLELTRELYESITSQSRYEAQAIGGSTWTSIGPANSAGRMSRIATHPTIAGTFLAGSAGGGVWRTTDGGSTWTALTDAIPNLNVGAIVYAPSDPQTIYVGTGEGDAGGPHGIGLIWSTDGGSTWNFPSSVVAPYFYAISVDPRNKSILVVATPNGAFRSTTGPNGPWTNVIPPLYVTDLDRDPANPDVLYAAKSPDVFKSTDNGATWTSASSGLVLPSGSPAVRMAIAIAPSSPSTLYCATETYDSSSPSPYRSNIFKSTNGGASWTETALSSASDSVINNYLNFQGSYDNAIVVSPTDPNVVIAGGVNYVKTTDGGATWSSVLQWWDPNDGYCHADVHDLVYANGTLQIANDGGIWTSTDDAETAIARNVGLVTRQYYKLAIDVTHPHRTYGGTQDNGTNRHSELGGTEWDVLPIGGDGAGCIVSAGVPSYFIGGVQNGWMTRTRDVTSYQPHFTSTFPPFGTPKEISTFIAEIESDPSNGGRAYMSTWRVWKTNTFGDAWAPLPTTMVDGTTWPSNSVIDSLALSASNPSVLMIAQGSSVRRTTDGGTTWRKTSSGLTTSVNSLAIDPNDEQTAWAALVRTNGSGVFMTTNGGTSWTLRSNGLPMWAPLVIRVDPSDSNTIYCGTEAGLYRSTDKGMSWARFPGLPAVSVYDIRIHPNGSLVRVATHGRGVWQLDIPGITNQPPTASISMPSSEITVSTGTSVVFTGTVDDADSGDSTTGLWTFPDTWETLAVPDGTSTVPHEFHTAGTFAVTLRARDESGSMATANVVVRVVESADSCSTPIVIPAAGPFPVSTRFNVGNSTASGDPSPLSSCAPFDASRSVALSFTPAQSGTYDFSVCGSDGGAGIVLYTGDACGPYTEVPGACLMDSTPTRDCATDPKLSVSLTAGVPIRIIAIPYYNDTDWLSVTVSRAPIATAVTSVVPRAGDAAGGMEVFIDGSGFTAPATVSFGQTAATNVRVLSPNTIAATVPPHAAGAVDVTVTSNGSSAMNGEGYIYTMQALAAPTNVLATAVAASTIQVTWQAVSGAMSYEVLRRANDSYAVIGTTSSLILSDTSASPGTAYLYKVRALGLAGAGSPDSAPDLGTAIVFTDPSLVAGTTRVKFVHLSQLRDAVQAVRQLAGLTPASFSATAGVGMPVSFVHLMEVRNYLNHARTVLLLPGLTFSSASDGTLIRAVDFAELRNGVE